MTDPIKLHNMCGKGSYICPRPFFTVVTVAVYDLSSESYWTIRASNWENLLAPEKIYWPRNNEVYFYLTIHFITKHKQYSLQ